MDVVYTCEDGTAVPCVLRSFCFCVLKSAAYFSRVWNNHSCRVVQSYFCWACCMWSGAVFFKLNEQSTSRNKRCFATGAVTLTLISIIASVSIVAASLQSPNLEQIMDEARERVNASHLQATLRETERQKQRITEVDERFDKRERRIKSELLPDIKKLRSLIEIEKGVTFQSGPNKGSSLGPRMVILQDRLAERNMEFKARMSELDIERNSELKLLAQQLREAQAFLDNRRDGELVEITPDLYKEKCRQKVG